MATKDKREPGSFVADPSSDPAMRPIGAPGSGGPVTDPAARSVATVTPPPPPTPVKTSRIWPRRLALLLVLVLVAGGAAWFAWGRPMAVIATQPWRGSAIEAVYATGIVEAVDLARVGTTVAGRIVSLAAQEGDAVRRGQVMAQLDDSQPRHRLEDANARLFQAEQELTRARDLLARGVRTVQEMERVREERDRAAAGLRLAARQVEEHRIAAPLDGVVTRRPVEAGETVAAHQTLFEVVSDAHLRVAADVDERDIPQVRIGAVMALRSEAFPEEAFTARVTNIRQAGETATRTFRVEADLARDTKLRIGMTVDVNIVTAERRNALLVPARAVRNDPPQGGRPGPAYVFRVDEGHALRTPVETGAVGAEVIELRAGLDAAATIVADPPQGLADGQPIRVQATEAPPR